jgi:hypothetical protein
MLHLRLIRAGFVFLPFKLKQPAIPILPSCKRFYCPLFSEKSPVANGKKAALVEVTSPVVCAAGKRKASSRRIVVSSDEEENASPRYK